MRATSVPPDLIDLPELGTGDDPPMVATENGAVEGTVETIEMMDLPPMDLSHLDLPNLVLPPSTVPSAPILKLVVGTSLADVEPAFATGQETENVTEHATEIEKEKVPEPAAELTTELADELATPLTSDAEPEEIAIGNVRLSESLWKILCDEARQHLATLESELSVLQFDPRTVPSAEMIRAGHTLCGIHRTGGFPLVAETAGSLEQALLALAERGAPLPSNAQPVLARAVAGLTQFVGRIEAREAFFTGDQTEANLIQADLDELRQEAASRAWNAETAAADVARHDEEAHSLSPAVTSIGGHPGNSHAELATLVAAVHHDETFLPLALEDPLATIRDDVDDQVLPIFLDEAAELFPQAGEELRAWRRNPHDSKPVAELRRTLHTLKGSARMAGAMRLGQLTHLMESHVDLGDGPSGATPELFEALETSLDRIAFVLDRLGSGETNSHLPWVAEVPDEAPAASPVVVLPDVMPAPAPIAAERPVVVPLAPPILANSGLQAAASVAPAASTPASPPIGATAATTPAVPAHTEAVPELETGTRAQLRVRADVIDRLVNEAGEVAIARARVEGELRSLKANLLELNDQRDSPARTNARNRNPGGIADTVADVADAGATERLRSAGIRSVYALPGVDAFAGRGHQRRIHRPAFAAQEPRRCRRRAAWRRQGCRARCSSACFSIRTVPFGSLSERLYRILRSTAKELNKRANLEIHGAKVELDRSVLEKLVGPLEHLLRNALDHGIESRDARIKSGKLETGEISLTVRQVGNEVVIDLADDGSGVDFGRVRERARSLGLFAAGTEPTDAQLVEFLFQPGFSTASKVTQISGRGIGMDVVRAEIGALGGRVEVATTLNKGTRFTLTMPLTLAVAQALLIRAGGRLWALPAPMVEQVQQIKGQALLDLYIQRKVEWQGRVYPFHYLPRLLGDTVHNPETLRYNSVLLLRSGQTYAAIHVDEMVGTQEVVVKNIGPQLARVSGISGATVLGSGEIVLIINPVQLAGRTDVPKFESDNDDRSIGDRPRAPVAAVSTEPLVMIVDDSLTVRKITSRLLQREGFAVTTAKDGVDALQLLGEQIPDVILLDIEMPRMDGFEFAKTIKGDPKYVNIPIIMITSRTAEKHRSRAAELGVDLYLGKPYQEDELLHHLREMTGIAASL